MSGIINQIGSKTKIISGNVGIGTSAPSSNFGSPTMLEIKGTTPVLALHESDGGSPLWEFAATGNKLRILDDAYDRLVIDDAGGVSMGDNNPDGMHLKVTSTASETYVRVANAKSGGGGQSILILSNDAGNWQVKCNGSDELVFRDNEQGADRAKIHNNGDFYTNDGSISSIASDVRVKKDIVDLVDGLSIINQLRPVTFSYNGKSEFHSEADSERTFYGLIADELKEVAPQYVIEGKGKVDGVEVEDFKTLSMTKMLPMILKSIQELSAKNDALEAKVTALENT